MAEISQQQPGGPLRNAEHDRNLHDVMAVVTAIARPVPSVLRVTARLDRSGDDTHWTLPNVAFRIHLDGPAYGGASRIYTVRSYDAAASAFTFDIVLHEHASPMMRWGASLCVADTFRLTGPRPQFTVADGKEKKIALFLDETGIPALYAMLKQWPANAACIGWVVTDDEAAFKELPAVPGLAWHCSASALPTWRRTGHWRPRPGPCLSRRITSSGAPASAKKCAPSASTSVSLRGCPRSTCWWRATGNGASAIPISTCAAGKVSKS